MKKITIHTATYNRADTLEKAYQSLQSQTCLDFEWFVTDNGSTDNTPLLFEKWSREETRFPIHYHYIKERGIPRAFNYAIPKVEGEYFFMLDSDDTMLPNAVEELYKAIEDIDDKEDFVGAGFVIVNQVGKPLKGVWPKVNDKGYVDCKNTDRYKYDLDADMRELYKVEILKKYPFPVWEGEIYAPEQLCANAMALDGYKIRWYSKAIYVAEYLDGGQTKGVSELLKKNKMGYAMMHNQNILVYKSFKQRFKAASNHIALSIAAGHPGYILKSNNLGYTALALPYGVLLGIRRKHQLK